MWVIELFTQIISSKGKKVENWIIQEMTIKKV